MSHNINLTFDPETGDVSGHIHEGDANKAEPVPTWQAPHERWMGRNVFIRTITYHYTGRVVGLDDTFVTLEDAAWIADSGRFAQALYNGTLNEVEPYPDRVQVALSAIVDVSPWLHDLPRSTK